MAVLFGCAAIVSAIHGYSIWVAVLMLSIGAAIPLLGES